MLVSFGAPLVLIIFMRTVKGYFERIWWIERLPEALLVVVLSASMAPSCFRSYLTGLHDYFMLSALGRRTCR
ncbi:hypothetical protein BDR07DRAFT_1408893 [Suillus spraguei]|nr:hypothetical protein BDR07DRAFT_1408893 [Suillus spraguei]